MKIFVYKTLFVMVCVLILFQLTIGAKIKELKNEIGNFKSQENISFVKEKIRDELKNATEKDNYLTPEDAKLINDFINKIKEELSETK
tara:strand:- start:403 stop:666 length:264 start_codon:yes stop_codon:yes gene_type:complete